MSRLVFTTIVSLGFVLGPTAVFAQFGGMGGMGGGGMGGMGGGMRGGMAGQGMMGMGGFGAMGQRTVERSAEIETQGGQKLAGTLQLPTVFVDTEVGQYHIKPEQIKTIRLSKRAERVRNDGPGGVEVQFEATVTTNSGKEVKGIVQNAAWVLEVEIGSVTLDLSKVKTMTFAASKGSQERQSAKGKESPAGRLRIMTIEGPGVVGLLVSGPRITRLAAAREVTGEWVPVELREPVEGRAVPIVGSGVVAYGLGRHVYAFSSERNKWDVLDLPEGSKAAPIVGAGTVRVENDGQVHEFHANTGKWKHVDMAAVLSAIQEKALRALEQEPTP
jgi:hypothetical protein